MEKFNRSIMKGFCYGLFLILLSLCANSEDLVQTNQLYKVEVIPNYKGPKGRSMITEVVIPSQENNTSHSTPSAIFSLDSKSVKLDWQDNSEHSAQLTSVYLKIFIDGDVSSALDVTNSSIQVPRICFLQSSTTTANKFSLSIPPENACPIQWKPIKSCRKYRFEITPEYSNSFTGVPIIFETFRAKTGKALVKRDLRLHDECPSGTFYCILSSHYTDFDFLYSPDFYDPNKRQNCHDINMICDGNINCNGGMDERNCMTKHGFQCGRQRIDYDKVCDGKVDCIDGSDEHRECDYYTTCYEVTPALSGSISTPVSLKGDRNSKKAQNTVVLLSALLNHIIWVAFTKFDTEKSRHVNVFDGPYSSSPLLLSESGSIKPQSVRSSSNELYLEFPSYSDTRNHEVEFYYTTMENTGKQFIPGCGGYAYGDGVIFSPNTTHFNANTSDCIWYLEASRNEENTILLKINQQGNRKNWLSGSHEFLPFMTIFDGWSLSDRLLYDGQVSSNPNRSAVYSTDKKMMIQFKQPKTAFLNDNATWRITSIPNTKCVKKLSGVTGTIKSPSYPAPYPVMTDCRWSITTPLNSTIQLLFALFETQEGFDYVYVYDGPTTASTLLLEKSGSVSMPFTVISSTNEIVIRFTSDDSKNFPGFLAVFTAV